ncbi:hypothetical protein MTBPR1_140035 [Candidatus Terasakiella magnetica]|uniref:Uncharacterized protein n=1 Tax=Candidatus Terasakiella magnetica TaxID=1867952 RepID=A0A1C3RF59_9PROT|nr:hypothetical protein [Candidatus Terasakiella magnetica]SCA55917.1 hypothetical protein MTBPR1_140035 [Candidatus Terasakiella magnetica]
MNTDTQTQIKKHADNILYEFSGKVHLNEKYGDTAQGWADFVTEDLFEHQSLSDLDYDAQDFEEEVFKFLTEYFKALPHFEIVSLTQFAKGCSDFSRAAIEKLLDNKDIPEEYYIYQGKRTYINPRLSLWLDQVYPLKQLAS